MNGINLFESKQVADVVQVLTDIPNPTDYIKKMRKRDELISQGWGQLVPTFS